ncbi:MAG: hypothetical protein ABUK18_04325 [Candidatus Bathyarchaeia archaeon]
MQSRDLLISSPDYDIVADKRCLMKLDALLLFHRNIQKAGIVNEL